MPLRLYRSFIQILMLMPPPSRVKARHSIVALGIFNAR
jgi:hypothetical protein